MEIPIQGLCLEIKTKMKKQIGFLFLLFVTAMGYAQSQTAFQEIDLRFASKEISVDIKIDTELDSLFLTLGNGSLDTIYVPDFYEIYFEVWEGSCLDINCFWGDDRRAVVKRIENLDYLPVIPVGPKQLLSRAFYLNCKEIDWQLPIQRFTFNLATANFYSHRSQNTNRYIENNDFPKMLRSSFEYSLKPTCKGDRNIIHLSPE